MAGMAGNPVDELRLATVEDQLVEVLERLAQSDEKIGEYEKRMKDLEQIVVQQSTLIKHLNNYVYGDDAENPNNKQGDQLATKKRKTYNSPGGGATSPLQLFRKQASDTVLSGGSKPSRPAAVGSNIKHHAGPYGSDSPRKVSNPYVFESTGNPKLDELRRKQAERMANVGRASNLSSKKGSAKGRSSLSVSGSDSNTTPQLQGKGKGRASNPSPYPSPELLPSGVMKATPGVMLPPKDFNKEAFAGGPSVLPLPKGDPKKTERICKPPADFNLEKFQEQEYSENEAEPASIPDALRAGDEDDDESWDNWEQIGGKRPSYQKKW